MTNYLSNINVNIKKLLREIAEEADREELRAFIVGGIVRDLILKKKNLDLDIVIEGEAIKCAKALAKKWKSKATVFEQFKTATVYLSNGYRIDFATARKERYPAYGSLPVVESGTLKDDLFRRDFTINAMAICINKNNFASLVDEFNGKKDLKEKKIRVLHDKSFLDDPTRILRAVRFEGRLKFLIEKRTLFLLKKALKGNAVSLVKAPRYFVEFRKILKEAYPAQILKRLNQLNALKFLSPNFKLDLQFLSSLESNILKLKKHPLNKDKKDWSLYYLMALVKDLNRAAIEDFCTRFQLNGDEMKALRDIERVRDLIEHLNKQQPPSGVFQLLNHLPNDFVMYLYLIAPKKLTQKIGLYLKRDSKIKLNINGEDLKKIGVSGQQIGEVLKHVLLQKIDRKVFTRKDELFTAKKLIKAIT